MNNNENIIVSKLIGSGYTRLFLFGRHSPIDSIWENGNNATQLMNIVSDQKYDIYARLLASEILFMKQKDYPPKKLLRTLGYIYANALKLTGDSNNPKLSGNLWGFMYEADKFGIENDGILGIHLLSTAKNSLRYLIPLLDLQNSILYEGSHEATIGNSLNYRIKDAAAYYIGKILNIPVPFHEKLEDRNAEIERLKAKASSSNG